MRLKAIEVINNPDRISSIDIFRSIAIIGVVIYHYNMLPYGFLGVDLFFVISGLLVGGILTKEFKKQHKINFLKFFFQRGCKIWPSYYSLLVIGNVIVYFLFRKTDPGQIIQIWDLKRYLFFYQNYTGAPNHLSFDHVWSLCAEEHFYILLPTLFLIVQTFISAKNQSKSLFTFIILIIASGLIFKYLSFYYTKSHDTDSATHNRIDAFAWGILLNLLINYYPNLLKTSLYKITAFISGSVLFIATIYISLHCQNILFDKIYLHTIIPFSIFLMISGTYYINFSKLKALRFVAYYSYNWYLWHPIFAIFISKEIGMNPLGLAIYMATTFIVAMLATIFIEEPVLKKRELILKYF